MNSRPERTTAIEEAIKEGMRYGYLWNKQLLDERYRSICTIPEYALTVNVADKLKDLGMKVVLECHFDDIKDKSFDKSVFTYNPDNLFETVRLEKIPAQKKDIKRVDIVIYEQKDSDERTGALIEIKAINKELKQIKKDIERLSEFMIPKNRGRRNEIFACYSTYLRLFDPMKSIVTQDNISAFLEKEKARIEEKMLCDFRYKYTGLQYSVLDPYEIESRVENDDISEELLSNYSPEELTYAMYCFIIKIEFRQD